MVFSGTKFVSYTDWERDLYSLVNMFYRKTDVLFDS
jgi:hypothetical protein